MSNVFMVDARSRSSEESLVRKLELLMDRAGLPHIIGSSDRVAVKTHMGAPLTTRYLRSFYVRTAVDYVKKLGAKPTVVETTGLGLLDPRGTAKKYLEVALMHGFSKETLGAEILIMDGELGLDCAKVEVKGFKLKEISIPKTLLEFDFILNLTHFKGHEMTVFSGAIKNIGVGCVGKETKYFIHYLNKPSVDIALCNGCGECVKTCPVKAIHMVNGKAVLNQDVCYGCKACQTICPVKALKSTRITDPSEIQLRVLDATYGLLKTIGFNKVLNVNFLLEVDWKCDCEHQQLGWSDLPIVPDIGILASKDIVAVDKASIDLVNAAPAIPGSQAYEVGAINPGSDKFKMLYPKADWMFMLKNAEEIGLGSMNYTLIKIR
ncbi:DUF362 domain-containing protein [Candidatus Bathyarchaeota archaeon]|nr:DUF362 domain-containing protein [Candidatus Bathyarchaeota archaeon]MBS7612779.1 DUF362 domain-containing protein [Candidatus Bathyarchaeota archaeon]MBS7618716.1 DUF362 domain-containing protein [Candidatus Bathyarchaeota archaeon]